MNLVKIVAHRLNILPSYFKTVAWTRNFITFWRTLLRYYYGQRFMILYRRQESRPSPRKRNEKKAKCLSEEPLQIAVKRREAKSKGEKERYIHLNAEFQKISRKDKKAFLDDQCKEIEENNRMGETRDLFKKIRATKGTFHAKKGSIKDRNRMDLNRSRRC